MTSLFSQSVCFLVAAVAIGFPESAHSGLTSTTVSEPSNQSLTSLQRGASVASLIASRGGDLSRAFGASVRLLSPSAVKIHLGTTGCGPLLSDAQPWQEEVPGTNRSELVHQQWLDARSRLENRCIALCDRLAAVPAGSEEINTLASAWLSTAFVLAYFDSLPPGKIDETWETIGRDVVGTIERSATNRALSLENNASAFFNADIPARIPTVEARPQQHSSSIASQNRCDAALADQIAPTKRQARIEAFERGKVMWTSLRDRFAEGTDMWAYANDIVFRFELIDGVHKTLCVVDPLLDVRNLDLDDGLAPNEPFVKRAPSQ